MTRVAKISRVLVGFDFDEGSAEALKRAVSPTAANPVLFVPSSEEIVERSSS